MKLADQLAERASAGTGDLILAYECPDCGAFHNGHADLSQQLARQVHVRRPCLFCGGVIHESKRQKAKRFNMPILYCSPACRSRAATLRKQQNMASTTLPLK